jgi:hypothetical protein
MKYLRRQNPLRPLAALALLLLMAGNSLADQWRWTDVPRVVAISDVHGAYDAMVRTLQNADVLGDDLLWSGGATHLVVTGDLLDRGPDSRQAMDLVMRLEEEAVAAGGRVHLLLGNHEVMNLVGDLRYVAAAEYAAFAEDDDEGAPEADDAEADKALPTGFLAHRRAFAADGQYGAWLLGKPLIVVVNDTAFVHGGLSPRVAELGLEGINGDMKARLVEYVTQMGVLIEAGVIKHTDDYYERPEKLAALPADKSRPAELQAAIDTVVRLSDDAIHDSDSPLWYRGNVACSPLIAIDQLSAALERIGAMRVVIGHTPTPARGVLQRLDGRVIEIDTGMLNNYYGGKGHALIIEGDTLSVVSESDKTASAPLPHPRRIDLLAADVPATDLEKWLANGEIVSSVEASGRTVVQLRHDGGNIAAVFLPNPRTRGLVPDLAAYRLDRLLNLGMVPATVSRTVDGRVGAMQFLPPNAVDESQRSERREGSSAWCPLADQWQAMYAFDALTFNPGRLPATMLYGRSDWQLILVGHGNAFVPRTGRPPYLRETELALNETWEDALARLTDAELREQLGDVLDRRRLNALIERRSELLREARRASE